MRKINPRRDFGKIFFKIDFVMPKWEAWNGKNRFSHNTCCKLRDSGGQETNSKMEVLMVSKMSKQ